MSLLAALSVSMRVCLILIACAMVVGSRAELWAVLRRKPGWKAHLSQAVFCLLVVAGAIISSVNLFPDAGWHIPRDLRLAVVDLGLGLFLIATLTGLYRRACKSGPDQARAALLTGIAMLVPGIGLVVLLTRAGAHG